MHIIFVLPGRGGGGGAHSVVQEACGLKRFGIDVTIATTAETYGAFSVNYPELAFRGVNVALYGKAGELGALSNKADLVVATTYESAHHVKEARASFGVKTKSAYYVQDYEPLFRVPGTEDWHRAFNSYALDADQVLFAKTNWLCELVSANHGRSVSRVLASIDHETYFPTQREADRPFVISAMMRPKTPRRAPFRTARVLELLAAALPEETQLVAFGADKSELAAVGIRLSDRITVRGHLSRREVAAVLRISDLFLDLSDYQAFGRTGLEAMACGSVALVPMLGGTDEYARNWENALVVDSRDEDEVLKTVVDFFSLSPKVRSRFRDKAIETALSYSIERAAFSELKLFESICSS